MPWPGAQATSTAPVAGWVNVKVYGPAAEPLTLVAGTAFARRSAAFTPETGSLKLMMICVRSRTVAPGGGDTVVTTGGTLSGVKYCQVAPGPVALKGFNCAELSVMPCVPAQFTFTTEVLGCAKVKVKVAGPPLTPVAGTPLMSRSPAFTPSTASVKVTESCVRFVTFAFAAGFFEAMVGGVRSVSV